MSPDAALRDQVLDRKAVPAISHCDLRDQPQVAGHELLCGSAVATLTPARCEHVLFLRLQHAKAAHLVEVAFSPVDGLACGLHACAPLSARMAICAVACHCSHVVRTWLVVGGAKPTLRRPVRWPLRSGSRQDGSHWPPSRPAPRRCPRRLIRVELESGPFGEDSIGGHGGTLGLCALHGSPRCLARAVEGFAGIRQGRAHGRPGFAPGLLQFL